MKLITKCKECDSTDLTWHCGQKNTSGVQDGLLRMHEITTEFFLGCNYCSETLQVVSGDKVAQYLTEAAKRQEGEK